MTGYCFNACKLAESKNIFIENGNGSYNMPMPPQSSPEPNKSTERYKQGRWLDTPTISMDQTKAIMGYKDHSKGHAGEESSLESPGAMSYGNIGAPKDFVPEDWEQRSEMTKEDDFDKTQLSAEAKEFKNIINQLVNEIFLEYSKKQDYTGKKTR